MKIIKIECFPVLLKIKKPMIFGGHVIPGSDSVVVKIHTDEGITGVAESGTASIQYSGESQDSVMGVINTAFGPDVLLGADPCNVEGLVSKMHGMTKHNNYALAIIDYALHDIAGKKFGVPVYQLLGGKSNPETHLGYVVTRPKVEELVEKAVAAVKTGFVGIKLKHAPTLQKDIENLEALREALGDDFRIYIDVNGAWDYFEAVHALRKLEKYNLLMCEQPLPWWDIDGMARLRGRVGIPLCADESAVELSHLMQIIEKNAADMLYIKIAKAGGLTMARKWVTIAEAANLPVMCGCMTGSGFEAAAQAHFIAATAWMSHFEQENTGPLTIHDVLDTVSQPITDDLAKNLPRYEKGCLYPPEGPGLGVELNEDLLQEWISPGKRPTSIELGK
jgi:L-alanine-DL-glutamate epimerase-like enolase superfamily enzyme